MSIGEIKRHVREFMCQYIKPEKPYIWIGEPFDSDDLGCSIKAGVYGQDESPQAHAIILEVDYQSGNVDFCMVG